MFRDWCAHPVVSGVPAARLFNLSQEPTAVTTVAINSITLHYCAEHLVAASSHIRALGDRASLCHLSRG